MAGWRTLTIRARLLASGARLRPPRRKGFTLVECLIASVVLALAVVAVAGVMNASYQHAAAANSNAAAIALARQLMEEITARPFNDDDGGYRLGPEEEDSTRADFDSAAAYHGYEDRTDAMKMQDGEALSTDEGVVFTRRVTAEYRQSPHGSGASAGDFLLVRVQVENQQGRPLVELSRLMARHEAGD